MKIDKNATKVIILSFLSVTITWALNHKMGLGPIVSNGIIGVLAGFLLSAPLAGATYAASFVGMSGIAIIPSLGWAAVGGLIVGIVLAYSTEIYAGLGGKGGTTAAFSTLITKLLMGILG